MIEILIWIVRVTLVLGPLLMIGAWAAFRKPGEKFWTWKSLTFSAPQHLQDRGEPLWSLGAVCLIVGVILRIFCRTSETVKAGRPRGFW